MVEETICLQCGDRGYENAFVYCIRCLDFAVHRYCLDVVPETFDEFVCWLCDDCNLKVRKQSGVLEHDAIPSQTRHREVSKNIKGFFGNGNKKNGLVVAETNELVREDGSEQTYDTCAKSDLVECGESASQHTPVQVDGKNDGNAILLSADVSKRSELEEEKVEGNLMEPIELSAGRLKQKKKKIKIKNKRKRNIIESTTEKDQHRLATATYDERVKVDINECTRSASDSTLPSKVKENECSEQKDQTCVSKPFDSITDFGIAGVPADHPVTSSNGPSKILKNDGKGILLPADFSKRSQLEEEKVEGNLIEPIELSAGCLNQKKMKVKIKKRERNIVESATEKDQHRLATTSYDECVRVDINKCTRLASDSTLPSKVKGSEFSGQKDQTRVSKPCDSITDLGITVVPADHSVISSNGPSRSFKNDGNGILLPVDFSIPSKLEEKKVGGNLIEPIELSAGCLTQKKRKIRIKIKKREINIRESTTEKDQDRLATTSYDECVKVDINDCTRLASDSTLPSKVKENEFSGQKDQTCVSKPFDSITDLGIAGVPTDHPVISSNGPSMSLKNDGNGILLPADVSTQSQLEEEKIEGNWIEPIDLSAGCLKQKKKKIKRKKKRKRNIMESTTEKGQHRLATTSCDERLKVDINECTRSASDSTLPSKVKENECSEQKDQTRVSKSFDLITDLGIAGVPADHPVISSNGPSMSLKNDGNRILLPADVSTRSQLEEKIEGNLIESIDLSAGCLKQKKKKIKRKRNIMESTTEKDQHRPATASCDERLKVDINECTRSASNSTLPSKVKENEFSEQKDQTCVSKPFDSITDLGIAGVPADQPVISSNGPSMSLKNVGNGILLPEDVSTQSQLEEEKIEGNLIEPIDLSAGCLKQKIKKIKRKKKRKRYIMESTTEKGQHRLATTSCDERLKVDINECTRSASDSTLPSKVKENECSEQKDQMRVSKSFDSITDLGIAGVPADHPVISSNGPSMSLKNDGNGILLPADVSTRSQLEEEKIEGNLIESIDLSAGCLKQKKKKIKRKKKRERNIMESTTEKDQHKLATASYDERVKVDFNKCTRSASDSALPSKVKENECSEQKDQSCVSKPFDSITDLGITGVPAGNPVISSDGPSRSSKKKKAITSSATIQQEQLHQTGVAQPLHENKDLYLESECAYLSTEERDLRSRNDPIENRGPEEKVEQTSTTCQSRDACKYYPKDLGFSVAQPIAMPIWRGSFSIFNEKYDNIDLLIAHISNKACDKVYEAASQFQSVLHLEMCPKSDIWPKSFQTAEPNDDNIALYFFPSKISEQVFEQLVEEMIHKELAFRAFVQNAELLIFTSTELPLLYWTFRSKYYLWGVFRGNQPLPSNALSSKGEVAEIPLMGKRLMSTGNAYSTMKKWKVFSPTNSSFPVPSAKCWR